MIDYNKLMQEKNAELYYKQGENIFNNVVNYGMYCQKLLGTLSAGAIALVLTLMSQSDRHKTIIALLSNSLENYLIVLLLCVVSAAILYLQGFALALDFEHQRNVLAKTSYRPDLILTTKSKSGLANTLNRLLMALYIFTAAFFFCTSFRLVDEIQELHSKKTIVTKRVVSAE